MVFLAQISCSKLCKMLNGEMLYSRRYTDTPTRRHHARFGCGSAALHALHEKEALY